MIVWLLILGSYALGVFTLLFVWLTDPLQPKPTWAMFLAIVTWPVGLLIALGRSVLRGRRQRRHVE